MERHKGADLAAGVESRLHAQVAANEFQSLSHAGQAETSSFERVGGVEPTTRVAYVQFDPITVAPQHHMDVVCAAMLDDIPKRLL